MNTMWFSYCKSFFPSIEVKVQKKVKKKLFLHTWKWFYIAKTASNVEM